MGEKISDDESEVSVIEVENRPRKVPAQRKISGFILKTNKKATHELDLLVGEFFYSCNIPFSVAEHPSFKALLEKLRPGYTGPNRMNLGGNILDEVYEKCMKKTASFLDGKQATLVQDGWSTNSNDPVIASCLSAEGNIFYISSKYTGDNKKSAEYCQQLAEECITEIKTKFNCEIKSFVSDNENKMKKMRNNLAMEHSEENFVSYGCASHYLNLAGQDITSKSSVNTILKQIVEVQKYFRNHHQPGLFTIVNICILFLIRNIYFFFHFLS